VEQHPLQGGVPRAFSLAQAGAVDGATPFADGSQTVGHDQPGVVVGVKLQGLWRQAQCAQPPEDKRHATRQGNVVVWQPQAHRVADPELRAQLVAVGSGKLLHGFDEREQDVDWGAGRVFQVQPGPDAGVQRHAGRIQIRMCCLYAATGMELVERVVVRDRGQHAGFTHTE
jgi:hypothetical protein